MKGGVCVAVLLATLTWPTLCLGHGVTHEVFDTGTGIRAAYDDGSPMEYCDVAVYSPADGETEYQTGTTDPNGCFAFVPDTAGVWRVTIDDGMGHMVSAEVTVDSLGVPRLGSEAGGVGRLSDAVGGVGAILGLFGLLTLLRSSRQHRARHTGA